jgi:hypothetical protein
MSEDLPTLPGDTMPTTAQTVWTTVIAVRCIGDRIRKRMA